MNSVCIAVIVQSMIRKFDERLSAALHVYDIVSLYIPAGHAWGYVVNNFISNNPGNWFLHCHIAVHQLEDVALIIMIKISPFQLTT